MEAVMAGIAIVASIGGGLYTTVYHSGASSAQILQLTQHQTEQDTKLNDHDARIRTQESSAAAEQQALRDIKEQLNRIERKL
jgi:uncharacterized protein HemX